MDGTLPGQVPGNSKETTRRDFLYYRKYKKLFGYRQDKVSVS